MHFLVEQNSWTMNQRWAWPEREGIVVEESLKQFSQAVRVLTPQILQRLIQPQVPQVYSAVKSVLKKENMNAYINYIVMWPIPC